MSAGTLTLTNKSAAVTGAGTAFSTELAAGDFIVVTVGGVPYTLPVKTVNSNTSLTLVSNYTGPTQAGAAWSAVPRVALNMVTAALVAQSAEALRGLNYDKQNWQGIFTGTGNVTVRLPDGSSWTGPAWNSITTALGQKAAKGDNSDITSLSGLTTALSIQQGGTGATKKEDARTNLGLGSSATRDALNSGIGTNSDTNLIPTLGALGLGYARHIDNFSNTQILGFGRFTPATGNNPGNANGVGIQLQYDGSPSTSWFVWTNDGQAYIQTNHIPGGQYLWKKVYTTANTTTASDGTLKAASPVARIIADAAVCERLDITEDGFTWCGNGTANEEAEGISISRISVGVYTITGAQSLATSGWQLLPPMDPGGMGELGVVEAEDADGTITVYLYRRKYILGDNGEIVKTKGELIDVPAESWIDVRLDMPVDSIWKSKQNSAEPGEMNTETPR
ncbi:phage tail protein [Pseudescherichia vulneris]